MASRTSRYTSAQFFLGSTHFLIHVLSQVLPAVLPVIRGEMSLTLTQASLLVSIPLLVQVVAYLPVGFASDKRSALVLALGLILTAAAAVIIPSSGSYGLIMLGFVFLALGSTLYHPPALKVTSEVEPGKLGSVMGIQTAGGSLGYAAGPILLGLIIPVWGWRTTFYIWTPVILLAAIYSYIFVYRSTKPLSTEKTQAPPKNLSRSLFSKRFIVVVLIGALTDATFTNMSTYFTSYLTDVRGVTAAVASIIFGIGSLVGIVACIWGGAAADRFGRYGTTVLITALMAIIMALIPVSGSLILVALFYVLWRCLYSASMPLISALVALHSESGARSLAFSVAFLASNATSALAPVATSIAIGSRMEAIFPVSILISLPGVALTLYLRRLVKEEDVTTVT
jgi:FSR family fosmidomycin resistance protein-like MFS transporter